MTRTRRAGFTLVEMLVVLGLIVVLAAISVAVSESGAFGSQKVVGGADRVSGWLLIAKQRALRDGKPRGVRFQFAEDPTRPLAASPNDYRNFSFVSKEAQYIEQPDAWAPNPANDPTGVRLVFSVQTTATPGVLVTKAFLTTNRTTTAANQADMVEITQRVGTGDLLVYQGASYRIRGVGPPSGGSPLVQVGGTGYPGGANGVDARELVLEYYPDFGAANSGTVTNPPQGTIQTATFAIQGQPQPLAGEPLLQLTGNSAIDVRSKTFVTPFGTVSPAFSVSNVNQTNSPPTAAWPATSLGLRLQPVECFVPPGAGLPITAADVGKVPQFFDILFAPSGQVIGTDSGVIALWVRDPDKSPHPRLKDQTQFATNPGLDDPTVFDAAGEQVLVVVSPRTGLIATQPVSRGADPHAAAKDGINSGL